MGLTCYQVSDRKIITETKTSTSKSNVKKQDQSKSDIVDSFIFESKEKSESLSCRKQKSELPGISKISNISSNNNSTSSYSNSNSNIRNIPSYSSSQSDSKENLIPFKFKKYLSKNAGCGQNSVFTFCLFKSSFNQETILVYTSKQHLGNNQEAISIHLKNLDTNEENNKIIKNEEIKIAIDKNRFIPTLCRYFKIESNDYIIISFREGSIYIYKYENFDIKKINQLSVEDYSNKNQINGVCLFKFYNQKFIISSQTENKSIEIWNFRKNIEYFDAFRTEKKNYFLDIFENEEELYIICGLSDEVVAYIFETNNSKANTSIHKKYKNNGSHSEEGHRCVVIYKCKDGMKLIDSDTNGKCLNIFDFANGSLLLNIDLKYEPLSIIVWNDEYLIVTSLNQNSMELIKTNYSSFTKIVLHGKNTERMKSIGTIDYNEDDGEEHDKEKGVIYAVKVNTREYGDGFVIMGRDKKIKLFIME